MLPCLLVLAAAVLIEIVRSLTRFGIPQARPAGPSNNYYGMSIALYQRERRLRKGDAGGYTSSSAVTNGVALPVNSGMNPNNDYSHYYGGRYYDY